MANFKTLMNSLFKALEAAGVKTQAAKSFIGKYSKPVAFITAVRSGNELVKNIPIIGKATAWVNSTSDKIFNSTFGKIPGIGKVLVKINELGRDVFNSPLNDPKWYTEHLGIHTNFNIPAAYPDRFPIPVAGGTPRVQSAVFYMVYNPNPDENTTKLRAEQKFALLKGIRGLSSVYYKPVDIVNYEECVLACHAEYYGLKRAIQLMQRYDLMKSAWPDQLVKQLGYDPNDLRSKLAQYKGYLAQCANALHELPISGNLLKKIKFMQSSVFPDSNDGTIATYYAYALSFVSAIVKHGDTNYELLYFDHPTLETNSLLSNILTIRSSEIYSYIIADYIGAFGATSLPKIDLDWDTPFKFSAYDENVLTQLQNTDILSVDAVLLPNTGVPDYKLTKTVALEFDSGEFIPVGAGDPSGGEGQYYNDKLSGKVNLALYHYYETSASVTSVTAFIPSIANSPFVNEEITASGDKQIVGASDAYELSVNLPYITNDEGLQLEFIQNKAKLQSIRLSRDNETNIKLTYRFDTMNFCCWGCDIAYTLKSGLNLTSHILHTVVNRTLTNADALGNLRDKFYGITLVSQCDWFPSVNYVFGNIAFGETNRVVSSNAMDWNIVGILGTTAYEQAVSYTNFSLKAPAINAEGKTIDNIQDVFNNK